MGIRKSLNNHVREIDGGYRVDMKSGRKLAVTLMLLGGIPLLAACSPHEGGGVGFLRTADGIRIVIMCSKPADEVVISYSSSNTSGIVDRLTLETDQLSTSIDLPADWERNLASDTQYRIGAVGGGVPTAVSQFTQDQLAELREGHVLAADWGNHKKTATFTEDEFVKSIAEDGCN